MQIRDRVRELRRVRASELRPNPKNWRTHPKEQMDAIRGLFAELGFAGVELARELEDGSLMLLDGHARAEIAGEAEVPVVILDLNDAEADKLLTSFDPIGAMAEADKGKLEELLRTVQTGSEALAGLFTDLAEQHGIIEPEGSGQAYSRKVEAPIYRPSGPKPKIEELVDQTRYKELLNSIEASKVEENEKQFLRLAACRHLVFDYETIANYYAQSSEPVKELFEDSALIIIDFDKAIEKGYTDLSKELADLYRDEYPKNDASA